MKLSRWVLLLGMVLTMSAMVYAGGQQGGASASNAPMRIDIFDQAANFQGIQPGWFAKIIKDKFNIEINILAPQVSGRSLYQSRAAAGNLGDITILDNADFIDSIKAGLLMDISGIIGNYKNLADYRTQITALNTSVPGVGTKIYGIPTEMTNTSPLAFTSLELSNSPWIPWDYYVEAGAPVMRNLDDLLDTLEKIQKAHPTTPAGDKAYAITLWPDWDNNSGMENIIQTVKWYGVEVRGSILLGADGKMKPLTDDSSEYLKMARFFNAASRRGLMNPDSGTNQWEQSMVPQMNNRQVYLWWYNWQKGFWNNPDRGNKRQNLTFVPVQDMYIFQPGDSYYGTGRVWSVGSKVSNAKRDKIMEFLDWMASPEGLDVIWNGINGVFYTVQNDGTYLRTQLGVDMFTNPPIPAEYGGGGANDGLQKMNQWIASAVSTNPLTKYPYAYDLWPAEIKRAETVGAQEWTAKYGAANMVEYVKQHNMIGIVPNVNVVLDPEPTDIQLIRTQCGNVLKDTSWKMVFAKTDAEFNQLWSNMKTQLAGFGWDKLVQFDIKTNQAIVDARAQAQRNAR